jgi:release factor glutamine methyltransferase
MYNILLNKIYTCWKSQPDKPEETPESTLKALYFLAAGSPLSASQAISVELPKLDELANKKLINLVDQRCKGVPLSYITGRQQFMGIEFLVSPGAMIPRKETEILGYEALTITRGLSAKRGDLVLLDVCSGCGNLILGVLSHQPNTRGFGSDLSFNAIQLAELNANQLGLQKRVAFRQGDLFEPFGTSEFHSKMDIIICNPPYISSKKVSLLDPEIANNEPNLAFDGGPFGLTILTNLIREAPRFLKTNSYLCFEVGLGQGVFVERMLKNSKQYQNIRSLNDENGNIRAFVAGN